jgi:hypothetical protein
MVFHLGNLRIMATAAVAALLLSGCNDGSTAERPLVMGDVATATTAPLDPLAGAPALNSCFNLSASQARAGTNASTPVDCYSPHTAFTFHVGQFRRGALSSDPLAAKRGCKRRVGEALDLGAKQLRSSVLEWVWFEPSTAQWSAGARWYRCDLVAWNAKQSHLKKLPSGTSPFYDGIPDDLFRCIRDNNGSGVQVTCDRPHDYRWTGSFKARGKRPLDDDAAVALARQHCAEITGTPDWYVTWPSELNWSSGDHTMDCYRETSS